MHQVEWLSHSKHTYSLDYQNNEQKSSSNTIMYSNFYRKIIFKTWLIEYKKRVHSILLTYLEISLRSLLYWIILSQNLWTQYEGGWVGSATLYNRLEIGCLLLFCKTFKNILKQCKK